MVDTFLYLGDEHLNGPPQTQAPRTQADALAGTPVIPFGVSMWGWGLASTEWNQAIPSGDLLPDLTTGLMYDCWWDGTILGGSVGSPNGRFVPYHPAPSVATINQSQGLIPQNPIGLAASGIGWGLWQNYKGSCWYANPFRFGPDARLMRLLWKRYYPDWASDGFRMIKLGQQGGVGNYGDSWKEGGTGWNIFEANYDAAQAYEIAQGTGQSFSVKAAFIDIGGVDIANANLNYKADVQAFVASLRTKTGNANLPIIWIAHSPRYRSVSLPGVASLALQYLLDISRTDRNFVVVRRGSNPNTELFVPQGVGDYVENPDPLYYQTLEHIRIGEVLADTYSAILTATPQATSTVVRAYISIGSSQTVGGGMQWGSPPIGQAPAVPRYGAGDRNPLHGGYDPTQHQGTPLTPRARIWDGALLSPYQPNGNANPLHPVDAGPPVLDPPPQDTYGGEITFYEKQTAAHPTEEIALLKIGVNGGSLNNPTTLGDTRNPKQIWEKGYPNGVYADLQLEWAKMRAGILQQLGKTTDLQGIIVNLSDNEAPEASDEGVSNAQASAFAAALPGFIADLRSDFATRIGDALVPIVLVNIHDGRADPNYTSPRMFASSVAIIKQAIRDAAATIPSVYQIELEELGVISTDGVHYTGELNYHLGRKISEVIEANSINNATSVPFGAGDDDGGDLDFLPPAGSLVVETGAGLADAQSYISVIEADTYLSEHEDPSAWNASDDPQKEQALRLATQYLDAQYGDAWVGVRLSSTQALDWPRAWAYDHRGNAVDGVPQRIKDCTAEMAARYRADPTAPLLEDTLPGQNEVTSETTTVGPISVSTSYSGTNRSSISRNLVQRLLQTAGLIVWGAFARR